MKKNGKGCDMVRMGGMKPRHGWILLFVLLLAGDWTGAAAAGEKSEPLKRVESAVDDILAILQDETIREKGAEAREEEVLQVVNRLFDFQEMGRSALARYWDERTSAEQDRFVALFSRMVKHRYAGKIDAYSGQKVLFTRELVRGDRALIYSTIVDGGTEIPIVYKLKKLNGQWKVYDLKIENVSLVANYRREFGSIMAKEGYAGLIQRLEEQLARIREKG